MTGTIETRMSLPLVFRPAMPCDGRMYADQIEGLKDLVSPCVSVLAEKTFAKSADKLLASIVGDFILAGTAYGGCLAMEVLARAPGRVRGLWLMNCQPSAHPDPDAVRATSRRLRTGEHDAVIAEFAEGAIPAEDSDSRATFVQMALDADAELFARLSDATLTRVDRWLDTFFEQYSNTTNLGKRRPVRSCRGWTSDCRNHAACPF